MELFLTIIAYIIVGILAGILGGLLGIGGGIITVPALYYIFSFSKYPQNYLMYLAIGTSLAAMIFNTGASTWAHNRRHNVLWDVFKGMAPGLLMGSVMGAITAQWLTGIILEIIFGSFLCILALSFWRKQPIHDEQHRLPKRAFLLLWSGAIGGISNILGIGGGVLIVPFLTAFKVPAKKAIGTSAACSLLVTLIGATSYLIIGLKVVHLPEDIGYIDFPAFLTIGIVSFLVAPYGAKLTHELPVQRVRKIFAIVLLIMGLSMII
jgi:uncharacterized membrane protein YfcA